MPLRARPRLQPGNNARLSASVARCKIPIPLHRTQDFLMSYQTVDWRLEAGILTLTLNRPDQLNAFTLQMMQDLIDAFGRASEDDAVRAIVVTGAGRAFCAG